MKKIIFLLIINVFYLQAQDSLKKLQIGLDFTMGNTTIGKGNIFPSVVISKGKHVAFLGPAFIYGLPHNPSRPIYVIQAGYQVYPNGRTHRFNLFFEYDFSFMKLKLTQDYSSFNSTGVKNVTTKFSSLDNYLGFGFRLNLIKGLYFKTNVGLGAIIHHQNVTAEYFDGSSKNYDTGKQFYIIRLPQYFLRPYYKENYFKPGQLVSIFKIGIGWDICSFKKKHK